jgi:RNA polymerase sigma factor (sigma-70 family)
MVMESTRRARDLFSVLHRARDRTDRELLARFIADRDEDAFEELVRRHGPLVLAVARRVTGNPQDAEDAFQAAFLVLARRAGQVKRPEQLGNWLYGVAYRTALEARAARRRVLEHPVSAVPEPAAPPPPDDAGELRRAIDEELAALPEKYRAAVVLCELEGVPRAEAAVRLKVPAGTLSSRLAYARKLLAARLGRRGFAVTAGTLTGTLSAEAAGSAVPKELIRHTARAAAKLTAGGAIASKIVSPSVYHLTEGVLKTMLANRLRHALLTGLAGCFPWGLTARPRYRAGTPPRRPPTRPPPAPRTSSGRPGRWEPRTRLRPRASKTKTCRTSRCPRRPWCGWKGTSSSSDTGTTSSSGPQRPPRFRRMQVPEPATNGTSTSEPDRLLWRVMPMPPKSLSLT